MVRVRLMALSGAERFAIGARMFETARSMVRASLPAHPSPAERMRALFERIHGEPLPAAFQ